MLGRNSTMNKAQRLIDEVVRGRDVVDATSSVNESDSESRDLVADARKHIMIASDLLGKIVRSNEIIDNCRSQLITSANKLGRMMDFYKKQRV